MGRGGGEGGGGGQSHLQKAVQVVVIELWGGREGIAEVLHGLLAVALQVWHDVSRVVPPQQIQHLHITHQTLGSQSSSRDVM